MFFFFSILNNTFLGSSSDENSCSQTYQHLSRVQFNLREIEDVPKKRGRCEDREDVSVLVGNRAATTRGRVFSNRASRRPDYLFNENRLPYQLPMFGIACARINRRIGRPIYKRCILRATTSLRESLVTHVPSWLILSRYDRAKMLTSSSPESREIRHRSFLCSIAREINSMFPSRCTCILSVIH